MAGILPDDADIELIGQLLGLLSSSIVSLNLIKIEQNCPMREFRAAMAATFNLLASTPQAGDRIAGARAQVHDFEVDWMTGGLQKIVEQLPISLLGFPFAA